MPLKAPFFNGILFRYTKFLISYPYSIDVFSKSCYNKFEKIRRLLLIYHTYTDKTN